MNSRFRGWAMAAAVWIFVTFWTILLVGSLFAGGCYKSGADAEQRVFRCGWSLTLTEPLRWVGEPASRYVDRYMALGMAHADLGQAAAAAKAFQNAINSAGLSPPVSVEGNLSAASPKAQALLEQAATLPPNSAARTIFLAVLAGETP